MSNRTAYWVGVVAGMIVGLTLGTFIVSPVLHNAL